MHSVKNAQLTVNQIVIDQKADIRIHFRVVSTLFINCYPQACCKLFHDQHVATSLQVHDKSAIT